MTVSRINDHKVRGGKVVSPWNYSLGQTMKFSSWAVNRLPEYIWLALILEGYGRERGLEVAAIILQEIASYEEVLTTPRLSKILSLPSSRQEAVYKTIRRRVDKAILSPLTAFVDGERHELFWDYFYEPQYTLENRLETLQLVIKKYFFHQSNEATDVRYLVIMNIVFHGKMHFSSECSSTVEALQKYPLTSHDDEKMRSYRPLVRAGEISEMHMGDFDTEFIKKFWNIIGMKLDCKLFFIEHKVGSMNNKTFMKNTAEAFEYIWCKYRNETLSDDRLTVILSMVTYSYKILNETVANKIGNTITARSSCRTMAEVFIMLKYLKKMSAEKPNIWAEYKQYGIGKYKLVLLKSRETEVAADSHIIPDLLDVLVNEEIWEEFIDSDLRYFDQMGIREKCTFVGEKELYDLLYDYDTSYTHGLWGAIREAAMVKCDNAAHKFHAVPDLFMKQNSSNVIPDMVGLMRRTVSLLSEDYELPHWYVEKYKV